LSIHKAVQSFAFYSLLVRVDMTSDLPNVKIPASLKSYQKEITQLQHISHHIWTHADHYRKTDTK